MCTSGPSAPPPVAEAPTLPNVDGRKTLMRRKRNTIKTTTQGVLTPAQTDYKTILGG